MEQNKKKVPGRQMRELLAITFVALAEMAPPGSIQSISLTENHFCITPLT